MRVSPAFILTIGDRQFASYEVNRAQVIGYYEFTLVLLGYTFDYIRRERNACL